MGFQSLEQFIRRLHPTYGNRRDTPFSKCDGICLTFNNDDLFRLRAVQVVVVRLTLTDDVAGRVVVFLALDATPTEVGQPSPFGMDVNNHVGWELLDHRLPAVRQIQISQQRTFILRHEPQSCCLDGGRLPAAFFQSHR